ncbi:hypothetical protein V1508DRAFT_423263 [Lipomyces doorenjongii]|uniref:uncharacterized protein n=1 Tax=Lipomyces doorenjongii TaxID=383834 RepID=UPI0034CE952D
MYINHCVVSIIMLFWSSILDSAFGTMIGAIDKNCKTMVVEVYTVQLVRVPVDNRARCMHLCIPSLELHRTNPPERATQQRNQFSNYSEIFEW